MARHIPAELYRLDHTDTRTVIGLDYLERTRYIALRRAGVAPDEALAKAREIEDPLPELDDLVEIPVCRDCFGTGHQPYAAAACPLCGGTGLGQ